MVAVRLEYVDDRRWTTAAMAARDGSDRVTAPRPTLARPTSGRRRPSPSVAARRYRVVGAFLAIVAACAVWTQAGATGRAGDGPLTVPGAGPTQAIAAHVWIVQPGDTIWGIARTVQPSGDIRPLVDALSSEVHDRPLQAGQQLQLP